jgi:hypothetical protein
MNCSDVSGECDFLKGLSCQGIDGAKECGLVFFLIFYYINSNLIYQFKIKLDVIPPHIMIQLISILFAVN